MSMQPPLFFSEVRLGIGRVRFQSRAYTIHQVVADLFGDRQGRGYLFYEIQEEPDRSSTLILSEDEPKQSLPPEAPGSVERVRTKSYELDVAPGTTLDYEIRLNATRVVTEEGKKRRVDVWDAVWKESKNTRRTPHGVYAEYLSRKLQDAADLLDTRVVGRGGVTARAKKHDCPIFFVAATLIGTLKVIDSDRLLATVASGIGRSKAFGCGLLCLSRPGTVLPRRYPQKKSEFV